LNKQLSLFRLRNTTFLGPF